MLILQLGRSEIIAGRSIGRNVSAGAQTATTTALTISPSTSPLAPQTVVTLTAAVTVGATPVHPGLVTFCDATASYCIGLAVLGTAQLTSDAAIYSGERQP